MRRLKVVLPIIIVLFLNACSQSSSTEVAEVATNTAVPAPTDTPVPTETAVPPTDTPTPEPTNTPEPTATPTEQPLVSAANFDEVELENGWTQYTLPKDQVRIAFPADWTVVQIDAEFLADALAAVGENNEETAFDFLSSDVMLNMASAGIKFMALDTDPEAITRSTPSTVNLLIIELPIELPFDSWVALNESQLETLAQEGTIEMEMLEINGRPSAKFTYIAEINSLGGELDTLQLQQYLFKEGDLTYILTMGSEVDLAANYTDLFPEIANTFELLAQE